MSLENKPSNDADPAASEPAEAEPRANDSTADASESDATESDASDTSEPDTSENDAPSERSSRESLISKTLPPKAALPVALAITIVLSFVLRYAFHSEQAGTWNMLAAIFATYLLLAAVAVFLIFKDGEAKTLLRPRRGDLAFGAVVSALMFFATLAGRRLFLATDTPRNWWVARIYLQLGDMSENRLFYVGLAVLLIAMLEEIVWRGLVMRILISPFGPARAWLLSSVLYGLSHIATIRLLAHPVAGPNPLLVAAAMGCGLVWGHLMNRTGRLAPSVFAHGLFSWAIVDFPLWRP